MRERAGEEREGVCVRDGGEEWGGERKWRSVGLGVFGCDAIPAVYGNAILRPRRGKRGASRHHTRLHRI